ncbi:MAG TPA: hypothetical protein GXZ91_09550 [Christensenellaceae bacterium]|jgi:N-acylglucosamine 2-epimerase|nr:hypothetical protein [Christensenellaceae bacterium]
MDNVEAIKLIGFYENELKSNILSFWLKRCHDEKYGGFLNCFDNFGKNLVSYDKYTWSQGRFVWMFSKLYATPCPIFSDIQRNEFFELAKQGAEFLMKHCLISPDDYRCVFLMERDGTHKRIEAGMPLDMSIYADCFVIIGLSKFASISNDIKAYNFAKKLYDNALVRLKNNDYHTLPYPLSEKYRAHGIPMIFSNVSCELLQTAKQLAKEDVSAIRQNLEYFASDILENFVDENYIMREVITSDNKVFLQILGQHMNPGHTLEDVWFLIDAANFTSNPEWKDIIIPVALNALERGWDKEYGGILHFCAIDGGEPIGSLDGIADEPMTKQLSGWGDKLWWIHSEALYSTLLCYFISGNEEFLKWHDRIFEYTFSTFPNPDREIKEWVQILTREGKPQEKVVALPVKDPFHITRNLILILELLFEQYAPELLCK